ncbi:MAG: hypothetical protein Kow00107_08860 [Planctomycetota bacterium]
MNSSPVTSKAKVLASTGAFFVGAGVILKLLLPSLDTLSPAHLSANQGILAGLAVFFGGVALSDIRRLPPLGWGLMLSFVCFVFARSLGAVPAYGLDWTIELVVCIGAAVCFSYLMRCRMSRAILLGVFAAAIAAILVWGLGQELLSLPELRNDPTVLDGIPPERRAEFLDRLNTLEVFGPFTISNAMAAAAILFFFPFASLALLAGKGKRTVFIVAAALALLALLLTRSKGGFIAFAFGVVVLALSHWRMKGAGLRKVLTAFSVISVLGVAAVTSLLLFGPSDAGRASAEVRLGYYSGAVRIIAENPLLGVGSGLFADAYTAVRGENAGETRHVHNDYLEIATESGVVALALFLLSIAVILLTALPSRLPEDIDYPAQNQEHPERWSDESKAGILAAICAWLGITIGLVGFGICDFDNILAHVKDGDVLWHALLVLTVLSPPVTAWFAAKSAWRWQGLRPALAVGLIAGCCAFLFHSLADFNLYNEGARLVFFSVLGMSADWKDVPRLAHKIAGFLMAFACIVLFVLASELAASKEKALMLESYTASAQHEQLSDSDRAFLLRSLKPVGRKLFDYPETFAAQGRLCVSFGVRYEGFAELAAENFEVSVLMNPLRAQYHEELGDAYLVLGRKPEALRSYETALSLDPRKTVLLEKVNSLRREISRGAAPKKP